MIMSVHDLARALEMVQGLEFATRAAMQTEDLAERDAAINAMRLATALRRSLNTWAGLRLLRAELQGKTVG
ncbi:MAG: hypothetical protein Q7R41_03080 [Phycisphaerales bacterium]|nr:hypothetical protein [Phycisphaerales bacterium]